MFQNYNKVQRAVLETTLRSINQKELQATSMSLTVSLSSKACLGELVFKNVSGWLGGISFSSEYEAYEGGWAYP